MEVGSMKSLEILESAAISDCAFSGVLGLLPDLLFKVLNRHSRCLRLRYRLDSGEGRHGESNSHHLELVTFFSLAFAFFFQKTPRVAVLLI